MTEVRDGSDQIVSRYTYDPFGYRLSKEVTAVGAANTGANPSKRLFLQAEEGLLAELDMNGNVLQSYGWQPGRSYGVSPMFVRAKGAYAYYHNDPLGQPRLLIDKDGRAAWEASKVSAFGAVVAARSSLEQPWRLPGQYYDAETGLHYNLHRYYDAATGRYITSDPAGLKGGSNFYVYVGGNPLSHIDPYGLWSVTLGGYLGAGVEVTFGKDGGNKFLTLRIGLGLGGGVSYDPAGTIPGDEPADRCLGGTVLSASGQLNFNAGPISAGVEIGAARNYKNQESAIYGGPSGGLTNSWGFHAGGSIGGQWTQYIGR